MMAMSVVASMGSAQISHVKIGGRAQFLLLQRYPVEDRRPPPPALLHEGLELGEHLTRTQIELFAEDLRPHHETTRPFAGPDRVPGATPQVAQSSGPLVADRMAQLALQDRLTLAEDIAQGGSFLHHLQDPNRPGAVAVDQAVGGEQWHAVFTRESL